MGNITIAVFGLFAVLTSALIIGSGHMDALAVVIPVLELE